MVPFPEPGCPTLEGAGPAAGPRCCSGGSRVDCRPAGDCRWAPAPRCPAGSVEEEKEPHPGVWKSRNARSQAQLLPWERLEEGGSVSVLQPAARKEPPPSSWAGGGEAPLPCSPVLGRPAGAKSVVRGSMRRYEGPGRAAEGGCVCLSLVPCARPGHELPPTREAQCTWRHRIPEQPGFPATTSCARHHLAPK